MLRGISCNSSAHCLHKHFRAISADILGIPAQSRRWWGGA
jgi:hypothetical protein